MINPGIGTTETRVSLTTAMKTMQSNPKVQHELRRKNGKGLELQWFYTTNTWTGGDHLPQENQTMHGSGSIVTCIPIISNYLYNDLLSSNA